jgi:hypothetical protein
MYLVDKPSFPDRDKTTFLVQDIWIIIVDQLSIEDILSLSLTCRSFYWMSLCSCCHTLLCNRALFSELDFRRDMKDEHDYEDEDFWDDLTNDYDADINWEAE